VGLGPFFELLFRKILLDVNSEEIWVPYRFLVLSGFLIMTRTKALLFHTTAVGL
jgi:hypothetical protein